MIKEKLPRCMNGGGCPGLRQDWATSFQGDKQKVS